MLSGDRFDSRSLAWRLFVPNAAALVIAAAALAISPATISSPLALTEAIVLAAGLLLLLATNFASLRREVAPLARLAAFMQSIDPLHPGRRVPVKEGGREVRQLAGSFNDMLERLERERRESARRAAEAQEAERRRISLELHDEVGQSLTGLVLHLERLARSAGEASRPQAEEAREVARAALEEVREIAAGLRPEVLEGFGGLRSALNQLALTLQRQAEITIDTHVDDSLPSLTQEQELAIYRVVQEALTNAVRHGHAAAADVLVSAEGRCLVVEVRDGGRGLRPADLVSPRGIRGMRERAILIGGQLDIESGASGTTVRLEVPLP